MKKYIVFIISTFLFIASCSKQEKSDLAAEKMQEFVIDISDYARDFNPDFIIIPQNAVKLAYKYLDTAQGLNYRYLAAIDGFGVEELFYYETFDPDYDRLSMLRALKNYKKVMVSEYVSNNNEITDALNRNFEEGFICFPRNGDNYHYLLIPDFVWFSNNDDINLLSDAKNYLYLISSDNFASKQAMINAISATNFDIVLIDLFFEDDYFSAEEINILKTKANGAKRLVISYINIGSAENYRYYWQDNWKLHNPKWLKKKYEGYKDEFWVEFWQPEWQQIIFGNDNSYIKKIIDAGFDGAYLDNVEAYYFLYFN